MCSKCNEHHDEDCCCCECCEEEKELVRDRRELTDEEIESIIVEKYNTKDEKTKVFIRKALKVHGNWYDYSKVEYKNANTKVTIICPIQEHGLFEQTPDNHLHNHGCRKCSVNINSKKLSFTAEEFIEKAKEVHNNKYGYDKVTYINAKTPVLIYCPDHNGYFEQTPDSHLSGHGCNICCDNIKLTTEEFVKRANLVHNNKYGYDKAEYKGANEKVTILCPTHGYFEQKASNHLLGKGCIECGYEKMILSETSNTEEFISKSKYIHGNKYDYSDVNYINNSTNVVINCPIHGKFNITPRSHLQGHGCQKCNCMSIGEDLTARYLLLSKINYVVRKYILIDGNNYIPDFILPDFNTWIEYNGEQHYYYVDRYHNKGKTFKDQLERDIIVRKYCRDNSIRLIEIPYTIKTLNSISDFLDKVLLQNINPNTLVDYSKLYELDNTGFKIEDLFPT